MMKVIGLCVVATAVLMPAHAALAQDKTQAQASTPSETRQNARERIYGYQLMTPDERNEYRAKMRAAKTPQEREQLRLEHHQAMQARAQERGITLPDAPPAGRGGGMGPGMGSGMGPGMRGGMGAGGRGAR